MDTIKKLLNNKEVFLTEDEKAYHRIIARDYARRLANQPKSYPFFTKVRIGYTGDTFDGTRENEKSILERKKKRKSCKKR